MGREQFAFHRFEIPDIEELPPSERAGKLEELSTEFFIAGLDILGQEETFPNQEINRLITLFLVLIRNKIVSVGLIPNISSLTFRCDKEGLEETAIVLVPTHFVELCMRDPLIQLEDLVFVASYVKDYYNGHFFGETEMEQRARAYEAELLLTVPSVLPGFAPNKHQREILRLYPEGLRSLPPKLKYQATPFIVPRSAY